MLASTIDLLRAAQSGGYAIGAFNVYNLEGVRAVVAAAAAERSPAMIQLHPAAITFGGAPLVALCLSAAREARVPISVHLDHATSREDILGAVDAGLTSVMADGSHLPYAENVAFTQAISRQVHERGCVVEVELGRLTGTEDAITVPETQAKLTDPAQAADFMAQTRADALAVCIGNVHGHYRREPELDFPRLIAIRRAVSVPLVLHGASGLPEAMVQRAIELGVCKFNVNTEVREAYLRSLAKDLGLAKPPDLLDMMRHAVSTMQEVVMGKIRLFGCVGKSGV